MGGKGDFSTLSCSNFFPLKASEMKHFTTMRSHFLLQTFLSPVWEIREVQIPSFGLFLGK